MRKFSAILYDSVLEVMHRKMLYLYGAVAFLLAFVILAFSSLQIEGQSLFGTDPMMDGLISEVISRLFEGFIGFAIFLMVFGSTGLLPSYLSKGRIELNLSKPITRTGLLMMKFGSVYIIMITILTLMCLPLWLVVSYRMGSPLWMFYPGLLVAFINFFVTYSIVFVLGLVSRSTAVGIIGYFAIKIGTDLLAKREFVYSFIDEKWQTIPDTLYHILPKTDEISNSILSIMQGGGIENYYAIWSSLIFAGALIALSIYIFSKKDY